MLCDSSRTSRKRVSQKVTILALATVFAHCGWAAESLPQELPPEEEQAALRSAEATGVTIYKHDHAAAVASDALGALGILKSDKRVRGWITESQGEGILVTFISGDANEAPQALYRVSVSKGGEVTGPPQELKTPQALTEFESGAAAARIFAAKYSFQPCAERYNTVVLPADSSASPNWVVYLIPGTQDALRIPLGGAHRLALDATAQHLVNERGFTRSCLVLGDPKGNAKQRPVMLATTHFMDPVPTEIHVFWNLWTGIPLDILTPPNGTIWNISKGQISLVKRGVAK
jgi:hypothetical protein